MSHSQPGSNPGRLRPSIVRSVVVPSTSLPNTHPAPTLTGPPPLKLQIVDETIIKKPTMTQAQVKAKLDELKKAVEEAEEAIRIKEKKERLQKRALKGN